MPHPQEMASASDACAVCHAEAAETYRKHGMSEVGKNPDLPTCGECHGRHRILPPDAQDSAVHPTNQAGTCGECHRRQEIVRTYHMEKTEIDGYLDSVHGPGADGGPRAACVDCHGTEGSGHRILAPADRDSRTFALAIPSTCGRCHATSEEAFWSGIHGQLTRRGETDVPVCTDCHGDHAVVRVSDPASPVARTEVAETTCARCHGSVILSEEYGMEAGRVTTFFDSYHGVKNRLGDTRVATCASCHGAHSTLPAHNPESRVHPSNVQATCARCHEGISAELAQLPIHQATISGLRTPVGHLIRGIYVIAIIVIIGLMVVHWLIDLWRHLSDRLRSRPRVRRMQPGEVVQHTLVMISFIVLVVTGFALVYETSWFSRLLFGWKGGFAFRGTLHRIAAIVFMGTVLWHCIFLIATRRGRQVFVDMLPRWADFVHFFQTIAYNLRMRSKRPREGRFTYVEKAEYWALVWGTVVMIASGMILWFDVGIARYVPLQVIDAALAFHFWEAWLATLAIAVWHFYSVLFDPEIYPMNPSWLDGTMPEWMHRHEHPEAQAEVLDDNAALQGADRPAAMHDERLIAADDDSETVSRERPHGHAKSSDDDG